MCTVLLVWRWAEGAPVVLAANRDELLSRPSREPRILVEEPRVAGGSDAVAGGTWLAVAADGRVAAVTNRWDDAAANVRDPARRSRGEIPLLVLRGGDDGARAAIAGLDPAAYNPFNVLYASRRTALVGSADGDGPLRVSDLEPGMHVLSVGDLDAMRTARERALSVGLAVASCRTMTAAGWLGLMRALLCGHAAPGADALSGACVHGDEYGTVSSSTVVVDDQGRVDYQHAAGRPCATPYADVSGLLSSR